MHYRSVEKEKKKMSKKSCLFVSRLNDEKDRTSCAYSTALFFILFSKSFSEILVLFHRIYSVEEKMVLFSFSSTIRKDS